MLYTRILPRNQEETAGIGAVIVLDFSRDKERDVHGEPTCIPASILYKSIAGPDGEITNRYRFIKNAYWDVALA